MEHLIEAVQQERLGEDELIIASQTAINFLEQQALAEPENQAELASLREPKESIVPMKIIEDIIDFFQQIWIAMRGTIKFFIA